MVPSSSATATSPRSTPAPGWSWNDIPTKPRYSTWSFAIASARTFDDQSTLTEPEYRSTAEEATTLGFKTSADVPLPAGGPAVGISVVKRVIDPFTDDEVALLEAFAAQAGNAVTNVRLLADIDARNTELAEALELQTAMSEVLRLISAHPGDLDTVLSGVLERAVELCDGDNGNVNRVIGDSLVIITTQALPQGLLGYTTRTPPVYAESRAQHQPFFVHDWQELELETDLATIIKASGVRSSVSAPLIQDGVVFGDIEVGRRELRPFDEHEAQVLQVFADYAAIAIGNVGLFNDLAEALQLQTATSEALRLISADPGDLTVVLTGIVERAATLCDAAGGVVMLVDGEVLRLAANHGQCRRRCGHRHGVPC